MYTHAYTRTHTHIHTHVHTHTHTHTLMSHTEPISRNQACGQCAIRHICNNSLVKLAFINLLIIKAPVVLENPGPKEGSENTMITGVY